MRIREQRYRLRAKEMRNALRETKRELDFSLNSLPVSIAILSEDGTILNVNGSWRRFTRENTPPDRYVSVNSTVSEGANYLDVCAKATGKDAEMAHVTATGIKSVISGTCSSFNLEYPCDSPTEQRWFALSVNPMPGRGKARLAVVHEDITRQKRTEDLLKKERKRVAVNLDLAKRSKRIADVLQNSMLQSTPTNGLTGIDVSTLYVPALSESSIGGDFFDVFSLDSHTTVLVLGDVSGRGLTAAGQIAEIKYALRTLIHEHRLPEIAIAKANKFLFDSHNLNGSDRETFVALAIASVNTTSGDVEYSAAGTEPAIVLRADGTTEQIEAPGTPIGMLLESTYIGCQVKLQSGDTLIMATDGFAEARHDGMFLGMDGIERLAKLAGTRCSLKELGGTLYNGTVEFAQGRPKDDLCLILARR